MASIVDRVRAFFAQPTTEKAAQTKAPYATVVRTQLYTGQSTLRRSARLLRNFADRSEALRTAINWRKQQISEAKFRIIRIDDPTKPPNPKVVKEITTLMRTVNTKRESLRSLFDQVIEDLLILDAGCIEKEKTVGGKIVSLWGVDGATIAPDPSWDGRVAKAVRYRQFIDGKLIAELRNDQLIYMMQNPTTHRILGWSPVETLVNIIEAELYGEKYDFEALRNAAPPGILDIGRNLSDAQVTAFREYYQSEIAGTPDIAIFGGGDAGQGAGVTFTRFGFSPKDMDRAAYKSWLINKIAFVMQIDKTVFGLVDDVNRSTSQTMSDRTDQGFVSLARLVAEYYTREIVWEIDENHGFEFPDLVSRDELKQAKIDQIYMQIGVTFPNEVRARRGEDVVPWGDVPFSAVATPAAGDIGEPDGEPKPGADDPDVVDDDAPKKPGDDEAQQKRLAQLPTIDRAILRATAAQLRYKARPTPTNLAEWEAADAAVERLKEVAARTLPFAATAMRSETQRLNDTYLNSFMP
jgi:hypothetical protein